jgi:hypothetical protein
VAKRKDVLEAPAEHGYAKEVEEGDGIETEVYASPEEDSIPPKETWTVNGVRVLDLPAQSQLAIPYSITDQAIAKREAKIDRSYPKVELVSDETDGRLRRYEAEDDDISPLLEALKPVKRAGMAYRFLSQEHRAGKRDYEIVKNPKTGDPVKYRGMLLGEVPETVQTKRRRRFENRASDALRQSVESMQVGQAKAIRDSRSEGLSVLRGDEVLRDHSDPDRSAAIGVTLTRGQGADAV